MTVVQLLISMAVIIGAAYLFTNSVEILGHRLGLGEGAVGSLLAAVGTALPETIIPVVALLGAAFAGEEGEAAGELSVGAILGAPFLLTTLAMFVVGISMLGFRERRESGATLRIDKAGIGRDVLFFLLFAVAVGSAAVELPFWSRVVLAILLAAGYVFYVVLTLNSDEEAQGSQGEASRETHDKLILWRFPASEAPTWAVVAQLLGSIAIMAAGAHFFVIALEHGAQVLGIPLGLVSLVLAPLATELPEKFNSIIWLRENQDMLALGNVTGAMAFQSTLPVGIGLLFTAWDLSFLTGLSAVLTLISGGLLYAVLKWMKHVQAWQLLFGGAAYGVFAVVAVVTIV